MKKVALWVLLLAMALPLAGLATDVPVTIGSAAEMDISQKDFLGLCAAAGFEMRADLALEGFARGDFNGDDAEDVAISLFRNGDVERTLLLLLSNDKGYRVWECEYALPPTDFDLLHDEDTFRGLEIRDGMLVLHQERILDDQVHSWTSYRFGLFGGELSLKQLDILRWNLYTNDAEYEHFDYEQGKWFGKRGTYQDQAFQSEETADWQGFSSSPQSLSLAIFDVTQFPTDLEGYKMWWESQGLKADITGSVETEQKAEEKKAKATPTPKPKPNKTSAPRATAEPTVTCSRCGKTMTEANYAKHDCTPSQIQCPNCKAWYTEGNEYNNHYCEAQVTIRPESVVKTCPLCGATYDDASGHTCAQ